MRSVMRSSVAVLALALAVVGTAEAGGRHHDHHGDGDPAVWFALGSLLALTAISDAHSIHLEAGPRIVHRYRPGHRHHRPYHHRGPHRGYHRPHRSPPRYRHGYRHHHPRYHGGRHSKPTPHHRRPPAHRPVPEWYFRGEVRYHGGGVERPRHRTAWPQHPRGLSDRHRHGGGGWHVHPLGSPRAHHRH